MYALERLEIYLRTAAELALGSAAAAGDVREQGEGFCMVVVYMVPGGVCFVYERHRPL